MFHQLDYVSFHILFLFVIVTNPLHLDPHGEDCAGGLVGEVVAGGPLVEVEGAVLDEGGAAVVGVTHPLLLLPILCL